MDEILKAAAQQVPALVVLVVLVIIFARALMQVARDFKEYLEKRDEQIISVQAQSTLAIKENTMVMGRAVEVMERVEKVMERANGRVV